MKSRILIPTLALAAFALASAATLQDAYTLRLNLKAKSSDKYKMEMVSNQTMSGPPGVPPNIDVKGSMDFEVITDAIDKGVADVQLKTTNVKIDAGEMSGMMPADQMPKEIVVKAKMDDRYRVTEAKMEGATPQAQMMMNMSGSNPSVMFVELPEKAVKIGDTWEFAMAKNPMYGDKQPKLTATLVALKEYEGEPVYEVSIRGNFDFDVNLAEVFKAMAAGAAGGGGGQEPPQIDMQMKGTVGVSGSSLLSRGDGKTVFSTTKIEAKQVMTMMGIEMNIAGVTTMNMKRAK